MAKQKYENRHLRCQTRGYFIIVQEIFHGVEYFNFQMVFKSKENKKVATIGQA